MNAIDDFLAMLAAERGAAANTLAAYRRDLEGGTRVRSAIWQRPMAPRLQVSGRHGPASRPRRWRASASALRQFYGFLLDEGLRDDDPSAALPRPAPRRPLPQVLTHAEVEALFARAEEEAAGDGPAAVRLLALLETALWLGPARDRAGLAAARRGAARCAVPDRDRARAGSSGWCRSARARAQALSRWLRGALRQGGTCSPRAGQAPHARAAVPARSRRWPAARGTRAREGQPARAAPCLRHPPARRRGGPARAADAARPCRHRHHADLHPCRFGAAGGAGQRAASACARGASATSCGAR